jgi:3-methyladenine DNA glycosylase AlkD
LAKQGDASKAARMQAYMKSAMPYHGVPLPLVRGTCVQLFADLAFANSSEWVDSVVELWSGARFREERYAAIALTGHKRARPFQTPDAMSLYEQLIVEGAWWDFVDELASRRVGPILAVFPARLRELLLRWSRDENIWKRRTAILSQLGFGERTDFDLLRSFIEPSLGHREFFVQKAIGWALRQYARRQPRAVIAYVQAQRNELSPLSKREALKQVLRQGLVPVVP